MEKNPSSMIASKNIRNFTPVGAIFSMELEVTPEEAAAEKAKAEAKKTKSEAEAAAEVRGILDNKCPTFLMPRDLMPQHSERAYLNKPRTMRKK